MNRTINLVIVQVFEAIFGLITSTPPCYVNFTNVVSAMAGYIVCLLITAPCDQNALKNLKSFVSGSPEETFQGQLTQEALQCVMQINYKWQVLYI